MPTDDQQVLVAGTAPTPALFTIPGNGQIRPKCVFAHFDGTGAAGNFKPTLEVVSDGGKTVGVFPTTQIVAAGGSADVSWFQGIAVPNTGVPGAILQTYAGQPTAADFTYPASAHDTLLSSGYPLNSTFNKLSDTSLLFVHLECDFSANMPAPDFLYLRLEVGGLDFQTVSQHISVGGGAFVGIDLSRYIGILPFGLAPLPSGANTVDVQVGSHTGSSFVMRSSTSCNLEIVEIQP